MKNILIYVIIRFVKISLGEINMYRFENSSYKIKFLIADNIGLIISNVLIMFIFDIRYANHYFIDFFVLIMIMNATALFDAEYSNIVKRGYLVQFVKTTSFILRVKFSFLAYLFLFGKIAEFPVGVFLWGTTSLVLIVYIIRLFVSKFFKTGRLKNIIILSNIDLVDEFQKNLSTSEYNVVAYVSSTEKLEHNGKVVLNTIAKVKNFVSTFQVDEIFVNILSYKDFPDEIAYFNVLSKPININITTLLNKYSVNSFVKRENKLIFLTSAIKIYSTKQLVLKRLLDIFVSLIGCLLAVIVGIIIYPIVKKQSPGPLLFKQKRVGLNGKVFYMYKFRSMYMDAEERKKELMKYNELSSNLMFKLENDPRIFPFGKIMRKTSLDELPQFFNVLMGDMSVVGTRPPTVDEYAKYDLHHFKRLNTKPGITGLWQISGRSNILDFEDVIDLDLQYIENWRFIDDIKIILKTFVVVLKKEGSK